MSGDSRTQTLPGYALPPRLRLDSRRTQRGGSTAADNQNDSKRQMTADFADRADLQVDTRSAYPRVSAKSAVFLSVP